MTTLLQRIQQLFSRGMARLLGPDAELQELTCILSALGWGLMMLVLNSSEAAHSTFIAFLEMLGPLPAWGACISTLSVIGLWGYIMEDTPLRRGFAFTGVVGWLFVGVLVFHDFHPAAAVVAAPVMTMMSALSYWRLRRSL